MLTYQDYVRAWQAQHGHASENAGNAAPEEQWNGWSEEERWASVGGALIITPEDPRYEALAGSLGGEEGRNVWVTHTKPLGAEALVDPAQQVEGEGWSAHKEDNQTPDFQSLDDESFDWKTIIAVAALPIMAGAATGAFAGGAGLEGGAYISAGEADLLAAAEQVGTTQAAAGTGVSAAGPGWAAEGGAPIAQAPAAAPVPASNGIINGARGAWNSASSWYNGLSPASRQVLGLGVSQAMQGLAGANAQRQASETADERQQEQEEDRIRRTGVPNFGDAFTPKPAPKAGIINSRRG